MRTHHRDPERAHRASEGETGPQAGGTRLELAPPASHILALQRTRGNRFVNRLLDAGPAGSPPQLQREFTWTEGAIERDPSNTGGTFEQYRNLLAAVRRYSPTAKDRGVSALKDVIFWGKWHIEAHGSESRTKVVREVVAAAEQEVGELRLDDLGASLARLSSTLDQAIQQLFQGTVARARHAAYDSDEARSLTIYLEEAESRLSSLQTQKMLSDATVRRGTMRMVVVKPIYVTTTLFPEPVDPAVWHSQFEDCRRVWAGLGVVFQEQDAGRVALDDASEAGDLLSHDGLLQSGRRFGKGAAMTRFNDLMNPHKPTGNVLPVFLLPTKLAAEATDGTTINARTVYIAGKQASLNVLAHEMSHVLGIDHPKYDEDDYHTHPGEKGSVADPSGGRGFEATIGHSTKTNPLSHYGLIESYQTTGRQGRIDELLAEARLDLPNILTKFNSLIARGTTNAASVKGQFSKLEWTDERAQEDADRLRKQAIEISAKIKRLEAGDVRPEELGISFPVRVIVEGSPIVIFGHD
jgi:hypothetical protein